MPFTFQPAQTFDASGTYGIVPVGTPFGPDGYLVRVTGNEWTGNIVLKVNQAPPGSELNLVNVAYQNLATRSDVAAGTAITGDYFAIVPATGYDLYAVATVTVGTVTLNISPAEGIPESGSADIGFVQEGTGAVERTVQDKLRETFSVTDFGAVGDGVTDDTDAIQAALDAADVRGGGGVFAPIGTYGFSQLNIPANVTLQGEGQQATIFARLSIPGGGGAQLFGIRLTGSDAVLRSCSVRGMWNPADPTTQTFDINIAVLGDDVQNTSVEDVETYNAHIGYLVGGLIGNPTASYSGQNYSRVVNCYAHDTYDLGFGFVAAGPLEADTNYGCILLDSRQHDSYATAGCEVRYQWGTQVIGFNGRNNTDNVLGAAIRLEETREAQVIGLQADNCRRAVQVIDDTTKATLTGITSWECFYGIDISNAADIFINDVMLVRSGSAGIRLWYKDGSAWLNNNERVHIRGGKIIESAYTNTGYGVWVVGTGYVDARSADQGTGLVIDGVDIALTENGNGVLIQAGGDWAILNSTFRDNKGFSPGAGFGIVVNSPEPNSVPDLDKPANGFIDNCTFITTGEQGTPIANWSGNLAGRFAVGNVTNIGGGALPNHRHNAIESGSVIQRGFQARVSLVDFAASPVSVATRQFMVRANATAGNIVLNLPAAADHTGGIYVVKKVDATANTVTITPSGAETIDGAGTLVLTAQYQSRIIQSFDTGWQIIGGYL